MSALNGAILSSLVGVAALKAPPPPTQAGAHLEPSPEANPGLAFPTLFRGNFPDDHKRLPGFVQYLILTVMLLTKLYIVKTSDKLFESNKITNVFH